MQSRFFCIIRSIAVFHRCPELLSPLSITRFYILFEQTMNIIESFPFSPGWIYILYLNAFKLELVSFFTLIETICAQNGQKQWPRTQKLHFRLTWVALKRPLLKLPVFTPWGGGDGYSLVYFPGVPLPPGVQSSFSVRFCSCLNVIFESQAIHLVCITTS